MTPGPGSGRRVLVTGAAGFLGQHLTEALSRAGDHVVALDLRSLDRRPNASVRWVSGDVTDSDCVAAVLQDHEVTHVVHAAAVVGVAASVAGPQLATRVNILGSQAVCEAVAHADRVERMIDISSEEYYGDFTDEPITEDTPALPCSPYGISKFAAERLGNYYADHLGVPYVAARLSWVYGPSFPRARLPQPWLLDIAAGRPTALARGGDHRIDFTYADDAARGLIALLDAPTLAHRAYHVASGEAVSIRELGRILSDAHPEWQLTVGEGLLELAPGVLAARKGSLAVSRIAAETGWRASVSLSTGLENTLRSLMEVADR